MPSILISFISLAAGISIFRIGGPGTIPGDFISGMLLLHFTT